MNRLRRSLRSLRAWGDNVEESKNIKDGQTVFESKAGVGEKVIPALAGVRIVLRDKVKPEGDVRCKYCGERTSGVFCCENCYKDFQ